MRVSQLMEALDSPGEWDSERGRQLEAAVLLQSVKPATPVFLKLSSELTEPLLEAFLASSPRLTGQWVHLVRTERCI